MRALTPKLYELLALVAANPHDGCDAVSCLDTFDAANGDRTLGRELEARGLIRSWKCPYVDFSHGNVTALGRLALRVANPSLLSAGSSRSG